MFVLWFVTHLFQLNFAIMSQTLRVGYHTYCSTDTHKVSKGGFNGLPSFPCYHCWRMRGRKGSLKSRGQMDKSSSCKGYKQILHDDIYLVIFGCKREGRPKVEEKKRKMNVKNAFYTSLNTFLDEKVYHVNLPNDPMIKSDNRPQKKA